MIRTLLLRSLWHQRYILLVLCAGMILFQFMIIHIGATMDQGPGIADVLERLPKFFREMVRTQIGDVSFPAFPAFGFEHPVLMGGALTYVVYVCTNPAAERTAGLLELLMARPLPRRTYLTATVANLLLAVTILPAFLLLGVALGLATVESPKEIAWTAYISCAVGLSALLAAWGGTALLAATWVDRRGTAVLQLLAAIMTTYLIHVLSQFSSKLAVIEWVSPFKFYNPITSALQNQPWGLDACVLFGVALVTTAAAYHRFQSRDL